MALVRARLIVIAAVLAALACAYFFAVRDMGVFAVRHVSVSGLPAGLPSTERAEVRRALRRAALRMTTLHVRQDDLERAVADHPTVRSLRVYEMPPDRLRIAVDADLPVARARLVGGRWVAIGESGAVLEGLPAASLSLPEVRGRGVVEDRGAPAPESTEALRIVAGSPTSLRDRIASVERIDKEGWRATIRGGPSIRFGELQGLSEKWAVAERMLSEPGAATAQAIDVRLPHRPALVDSRQDIAGAQAVAQGQSAGE